MSRFMKLRDLLRHTPGQYAHPAALRGVNLGGWLVLEKWMTPSLFKGLKAVDEYTLCSSSNAAVRGMLRKHRDSFITKADFEWLAAHGIQAVRLPVGYWTFGDEAPYQGTIEYVDRAFEWAKETGLKVLLDLHAAPGSQNGWDHSGRSGACGWHRDETNIIRTLEVLHKLAARYAGRPELLGIEVLNEPKWTIPRRVLLRYYQAAYKVVRAQCGPDVWVVFHDNFRPRRWKRQLRGRKYQNTYIDTHEYQVFSDTDRGLDTAGHLRKTTGVVPRRLERMAQRHPVVVGEWSLALDPLSLRELNAQEKEAAYRAYGAAQLLAYDRTAAWFYWSYKTEEGGVWSLRSCIERGWLPDFSAAKRKA